VTYQVGELNDAQDVTVTTLTFNVKTLRAAG
jgi:hypothetical protein